MLSLKRLTVFREVARQGSFSLAAEALSYSQPAVSHHVTSLEKEIGAKLLERGSRGELHLTRVGTVTLAQAEVLLDVAASAELQITNSIVEGNRDVRLGVSGGAPIVADSMVRYQRAASHGVLRLREGSRPDVVGRLRAREIDLGMIVEDPADPIPPDAKFVTEPLYDDPLLLVLPADHRLADVETVALAELAQETWIERSVEGAGAGKTAPGVTPWAPTLQSLCGDAGFQPKIALSTFNPLHVQRLVAARVGIAILPELALTDPHPRVVIRRIAPPRVRRLVLATIPANLSSDSVGALAEALRATSRQYAASQERRIEALLAHGAPAVAPALAAD